MCIVLDASRFGKFQQRDDGNMKPVRDWVYRGNGKIAYATTEDLKREWDKVAPKLRTQLQRRAKLKLVPRNSVQRKQTELEGKILSNDSHIIALAIVADAQLLISDDKDLCSDFMNPDLVGGEVYQTKDDQDKLTEVFCP